MRFAVRISACRIAIVASTSTNEMPRAPKICHGRGLSDEGTSEILAYHRNGEIDRWQR
jgi:hypothetical protein